MKVRPINKVRTTKVITRRYPICFSFITNVAFVSLNGILCLKTKDYIHFLAERFVPINEKIIPQHVDT